MDPDGRLAVVLANGDSYTLVLVESGLYKVRTKFNLSTYPDPYVIIASITSEHEPFEWLGHSFVWEGDGYAVTPPPIVED